MARRTWLVTGAHGMLGQDVLRRLAATVDRSVGFGRGDLDVTDRAKVLAAVQLLRPAVVINCAAWTGSDGAKSHEAEAQAVNGEAPGHLAAACRDTGSVLIHLSCADVFAGDRDRPYGESDSPGPQTVYGQTKSAGEQAVLTGLPGTGYVVRTSWLYGAGGGNPVRSMVRLETERDTVDAADNQCGQPTWTVDLADRLVLLGRSALGGTAPPGIYHLSSAGEGTRYELAREVFRRLGADPGRIRASSTDAFVPPARRAGYSVLGSMRLHAAEVPVIRDWRDALSAAIPSVLASEGRSLSRGPRR